MPVGRSSSEETAAEAAAAGPWLGGPDWVASSRVRCAVTSRDPSRGQVTVSSANTPLQRGQSATRRLYTPDDDVDARPARWCTIPAVAMRPLPLLALVLLGPLA